MQIAWLQSRAEAERKRLVERHAPAHGVGRQLGHLLAAAQVGGQLVDALDVDDGGVDVEADGVKLRHHRAALERAEVAALGLARARRVLDRRVGESIDIYVNNRLVARGEVVVASVDIESVLAEYEAADLDDWWRSARPNILKMVFKDFQMFINMC